jgi:hypothetical protein
MSDFGAISQGGESIRYRSGRGFVDYPYVCKGNAFTRGERPKPRVFGTGKRLDGSLRVRRLRTDEVARIRIEDMVKAIPLEHEPIGASAYGLCDQFGLYFMPRERTVRWIELNGYTRMAEGSTVRFRLSRPNFGGFRWWLECPTCKGLKRLVYGVAFSDSAVSVVGCQSCLGLTHSSRSRHKCLDQDSAILGFQRHRRARTNSFLAKLRVHNRTVRRFAQWGISA